MTESTIHCIELILECCQKVRHLSGDAAEIGVHRGRSARLICDTLPDVTVWLFDTLCGFPPETIGKHDCVKPKDFSDTSAGIVTDTIAPFTNYKLFVGKFPAIAQHINVPLKFVHVDCDTEITTEEALEWAWKRLVPGGIVLDDDYISGCKGAKIAVDRFCEQHSLVPDVRHGRAMITKAEATL